MDAPGGSTPTSQEDKQWSASRSALRWTPPPLPAFVQSTAHTEEADLIRLPRSAPAHLVHAIPIRNLQSPVSAQLAVSQPMHSLTPVLQPTSQPILEPPPGEPYLLELTELRATADAHPPARSDQGTQREPRRLMLRVARAQAIIGMVAMLAAPLLTLATGRTSALAFALHGIGAMVMFALATMVMHQAYPLLRGGSRTWLTFRTMLGRLAACAVAEGISGVWLLFYYHAETGPGHALAESAPLVDQLAMNVKTFLGLAAVLLCIAAWWSARLVDQKRKDGMVVPALAVAAAWIAMVCTLALGLGIAWIMPA